MAEAAISAFSLSAPLLLKAGGVPYEGLLPPLGASGPASSGDLSFWSLSCGLKGHGCGESRIIATRGEPPTPRNLNSSVAWGVRRNGNITWRECCDADVASQLSTPPCEVVDHRYMVGRVYAYVTGHLTSAHPISNRSEDVEEPQREKLEKALREERSRRVGTSFIHVADASFAESLSSVHHHPRTLIAVDSKGVELVGGAGGAGGDAGGAVEEGGDEARADRLALLSYAAMTERNDTREARFEAGGSLFRLLESCKPGRMIDGPPLVHKLVGDTVPSSRHLAFRAGLASAQAAALEATYAYCDAVLARRRNALMRYGRDKHMRIRDAELARRADLEVIATRGLLPAVKAECVANCELLGLGFMHVDSACCYCTPRKKLTSPDVDPLPAHPPLLRSPPDRARRPLKVLLRAAQPLRLPQKKFLAQGFHRFLPEAAARRGYARIRAACPWAGRARMSPSLIFWSCAHF